MDLINKYIALDLDGIIERPDETGGKTQRIRHVGQITRRVAGGRDLTLSCNLVTACCS